MITEGISKALADLRAAGCDADADRIEAALASSAGPFAWYAPSIDDTCTHAKKVQRDRDVPQAGRLFTVPLYAHALPPTKKEPPREHDPV